MGIGKLLAKSIAAAIAIPFSFMVIQVSLYEVMKIYGLNILPLYDGKAHYFFEYALWTINRYNDIYNLLSLAAVRLLTIYILSRDKGGKGIGEAIALSFLTRFLLILYVVFRGEISYAIVIPESLYPPLIGAIGGIISVTKRTLRKPKPLFDKLLEAGFRFEPHRLAKIEPPIRCPHCGAEIHSNADVCRKCGRSLKEFYIEKIPEDRKKYVSFSRRSFRV